MAIIIGATPTTLPATSPLAAQPSDLPAPGTAPEAHRLFDAAKLVTLLGHDSPLVRAWALEQSIQHDEPELMDALIARVADSDPSVAVEVIAVLASKKERRAVAPMLERFKTATGELAAGLAAALGQLAPESLLGAVKSRGRLDDDAYAATATSLAIIGSPEVIDFLDKALNRAAALPPDRRSALYGAALLSGSPAIGGRVIALAIEDSQKEEQQNASYPTRAAVAVVAGVPMPYAQKVAGLELYDHAREELELETYPALSAADREKLEEAVKTKRVEAVLLGLSPVLALEAKTGPHGDDEDLGTMPKRRKGLLEALIERRAAIGKLELNAAAVFVAAAARAASVILAGGLDEAESPAILALAKALESKHTAAELATMPSEALTAVFKDKSPREMRRVLTVMVREIFRRPSTLRRFAKAVIEAGHAQALIEATAEIDDPRSQASVLKALGDSPTLAEPALMEILSAHPLEDKTAALALLAAEDVRTERLGLLLARRFLELRSLSRASVARAMMRVGDARLLPVIETRAFPDEVEELTWVVLSLVHGAESTPRIEAAATRARLGDAQDAERHEVRVPMRCKVCQETLAYGFERVLLDVEAKDKWGDPAFVGEVRCKACGAKDALEPNDEAAQILTGHLMQALEAARAGVQMGPSLVAPAATEIHGRRMGLASALRALDEEIAASPDAIRPRLHRARVRLILKRDGVEDDIAAVLRGDATSVEAMALEATLSMRKGDPSAAAQKAATVIRTLIASPDTRLYDAETADGLKESLEAYLLELELVGVDIPSDLDLTEAKARRDAREDASQRASQIAQGRQPRSAPAPEREPGEAPAAQKQVGRNDPCPCGSGKKFKKCHGA